MLPLRRYGLPKPSRLSPPRPDAGDGHAAVADVTPLV